MLLAGRQDPKSTEKSQRKIAISALLTFFPPTADYVASAEGNSGTVKEDPPPLFPA